MKSYALNEAGGVALLVEYIHDWVDRHGTTWTWLFKEAGLSPSTATGLKRGSRPELRTLYVLARVMDVPSSMLFELSGYTEGLVEEGVAELTPDKITLLQEYDALPEAQRSVVLRLIRALRG